MESGEHLTSGNLQCVRESIFTQSRIDNRTAGVENANSRTDLSDLRWSRFLCVSNLNFTLEKQLESILGL